MTSQNAMQLAMQGLYRKGKVPYSSEKSSSREPVTETLGALVDGKRGVIGVSTHRALDLISLGIHLMSLEKVPTRWLQVFLGKFVHVLQFRRPLFGLIRHLWNRIQRFGTGRGLSPKEIEEVWVLVCTLPLCYTDLRAGLLKRLTASDASEWGGGLCVTQVSRLGELRSSSKLDMLPMRGSLHCHRVVCWDRRPRSCLGPVAPVSHSHGGL